MEEVAHVTGLIVSIFAEMCPQLHLNKTSTEVIRKTYHNIKSHHETVVSFLCLYFE